MLQYNNGWSIIVHPNKENAYHKTKAFAKGIAENRVQISLKKYQPFRKELQYIGNTIFIKERKVCAKSLRSR